MASQSLALALERFSSFGDLLKFLRRREGLTQRELSIAVGYSHAQVSRLELNQRPPDLATVTARFIPALHLDDDPATAARLVDLAALPYLATPGPGPAPFKGMQHFEESDAGLFFGREALTQRLRSRIGDGLQADPPLRLLAVVGASGIGKSSLVQAGLIPAVRKLYPAWLLRSLTPTARPLQSLAECLMQGQGSLAAVASLIDDLRADSRTLHLQAGRLLAQPGRSGARSAGKAGHPPRLLLMVDQFEELFTLCREEGERRSTIDNLMTAVQEPEGVVYLVLTLRADFYRHCAPYDSLRQALSERQEYIGPMSPDELRTAIEEPARRGRWEPEPGLVEVLLQDVGVAAGSTPEPGAMPLLSHALLETWHRRRGRSLTVSGYLASGGVRGAIAETADEVFHDRLDEEQQHIARGVFLRLTQLGEDEAIGETRRRVGFDELMGGSQNASAVREVLTILADARLVTTHGEVAEVAHEALIQEWPKLRGWLEQDREGLRLHRHLTLSAEAWERRGRDPAELYRGARLAQAHEWAEQHPAELNRGEREFLDASQALAEAEAAEREARRLRELEAARELAETQSKAARDLRRRALYLTGAFILALALAGVALFFGEQARQTAVAAQNERRIATARELAAAALNNLSADPERSILLALQSISTTRTVDGTVLPESEEALHRSIIASPVRLTLNGHEMGVLSAAFSPDGSRLATLGVDGTAIVWDPNTGRELLRLPGTTEPNDYVTTSRIAYSTDGQRLAAANGRLVEVHQASSGQVLQTLAGHAADVTALAYDRAGSRIASGAYDGSVIVWDAARGMPLLELAAHQDGVEGLTFSPEGRWLVTAGADASMRIWDAESGDLVEEFTDFTSEVVGATFSPDGGILGFASGDGVHLWRLDFQSADGPQELAFQELLAIPDGAEPAFSPDGAMLAAASGASEVKVWETSTGRELLTLVGHTGWVMGVEFSPDGLQLASTSLDGTVKLWEIGPGREQVAVKGKGAAYGSRVVFSPDGRVFATNPGDGLATLWDAFTGQPRLTVDGGHLEVLNVAFSPDGDRLATANLDGTASVLDTATGRARLTLEAHEFGVRDIAFSPDGSRIATGGFDGTAAIWDADTGTELIRIRGHDGLVLGVAFSPAGTLLATSSTDMTAKIWLVETGELVLTLSGHTSGIPDVAYSPDGARIATGSSDATAKIWDAESGAELLTLSNHSAGVFSVAFSPDGETLVTGSADNSAKLWDLTTGAELLTLPGNLGGVYGVAYHPEAEARRLAVASNDGTVRVFLLGLDDLLTLAQSRVTRSLTAGECRKFLHATECNLP